MPSLTSAADAELAKVLSTLPSTGNGTATLTASTAGLRAEVVQRWSPTITSSAYWQRDWLGTTQWGATTKVTW